MCKNKNLQDMQILTNNKILYCMYSYPMSETCMCWGLEIPDSWLDEVDKMSMKLEAMNLIIYPKYRVRIQMDQVKSKFGTLHAYYSIVVDPPRWISLYEKCIEKLMFLINKVDFVYKEVVDYEPYDETIEEVIAANKVEEEKKNCANVSNVTIECNNDGTATKKTIFHHYRKTHREATKHKFLHKLLMHRYCIKTFIRRLINWKPSYAQSCIVKIMDSFAGSTIHEAEKECEHLCEKCGRYIGTEYSPRCITYGWISYLCTDCAINDGIIYEKDGKLWQGEKIFERENTIKTN